MIYYKKDMLNAFKCNEGTDLGTNIHVGKVDSSLVKLQEQLEVGVQVDPQIPNWSELIKMTHTC